MSRNGLLVPAMLQHIPSLDTLSLRRALLHRSQEPATVARQNTRCLPLRRVRRIDINETKDAEVVREIKLPALKESAPDRDEMSLHPHLRTEEYPIIFGSHTFILAIREKLITTHAPRETIITRVFETKSLANSIPLLSTHIHITCDNHTPHLILNHTNRS
jgi:hypothetical protein